MHYAFRIVSTLASCLAFLLAHCPWVNATGGVAATISSSIYSEFLPSATASVPSTERPVSPFASGTRRTPPLYVAPSAVYQPRSGWIRMESGARQAYVGIHGGTAPLSLMCSSDGVMIAFTGRTGNDFMEVLRGGNASRASRPPHFIGKGNSTSSLAPLPPHKSVEPAAATLPGPEHSAAKVTCLLPAEPRPLAPVTVGSLLETGAPPALLAQQEVMHSPPQPAPPAVKAPAAQSTPVQNPKTVSPAARLELAHAVPPKAIKGDTLAPPKVLTAPASAAQAVPDPAFSPAPAQKGEQQTDGPASDAKALPADSSSLIFASSSQASSLKGSSDSYLPFGLTMPTPMESPEALAMRQNGASSTTPAVSGTPLKLGSYQRILSYTGSL